MHKILLTVHFYTNLLIPVAYGAMLLSAFSLKKSDDASYLPAMWTAFAAAACLSAPILGYLRSGPVTDIAYFVYYALTVTGLMLLLIATFLVSTEGKRGKVGIILLNIAVSAFALTGALVLAAVVGLGAKNGGFGPQNFQTIGIIGGIVFLVGWGSLMLFASVAKGNGEDRFAFRTWLFICGLLSSVAIVLVEIFSLQPFQQSLLLPMIALALFVPALPLLITSALLAATDGRRSAFSSILFESAAFAFVAVGVFALLVIGSQYRGLGAPNMEAFAKFAAFAFIGGLAALAAAPLGLKARK